MKKESSFSAEQLISEEAVGKFTSTAIQNSGGRDSTIAIQVNEAMNTLSYSKSARLSLSQSKEIDSITDAKIAQIAPAKRTYAELEKVQNVYLSLRERLFELENIGENDPIYPPPTKASVHRAFQAAFDCFDPSPENTGAAHFRDVLQQAAGILDIPALSALHTQRVAKRKSRASGDSGRV